MAYDLVIGKSKQVKDSPDVVGAINFDELPAISRLLQRVDSFFLQRISNLFDDQCFSIEEVDQALTQLLPLLTAKCKPDELALLHKLIAVLAYAQFKQQPLYGIAD